MIKILLLFILPLTLFGSKILSYNVYDRTDRVDVMLTFNTPYNGSIKKNISDTKIIIKLEDASIESTKLKQLSSEFINTLSISPMSNYVQVVASVPSGTILIVSKTSDAYGLRLRFIKETISNKSSVKQSQSTNIKAPTLLSALPTKKEDDMTQSYYLVIGILIVGILILFALKNKITPSSLKKNNNKNDVTVRFQKSIDKNNTVVMLDFSDQSYLVMMGANNLLLDSFTDNKPNSQEDFESILQDRHQVLEEFLESPQNEPMDEYRNKASTISYEV